MPPFGEHGCIGIVDSCGGGAHASLLACIQYVQCTEHTFLPCMRAQNSRCAAQGSSDEEDDVNPVLPVKRKKPFSPKQTDEISTSSHATFQSTAFPAATNAAAPQVAQD